MGKVTKNDGMVDDDRVMLDHLRIRPATLQDMPGILRLAAASFPEDGSLHSPTFRRDVEHWQRLKTLTLVALTSEGQTVGYARSRPNMSFEIERSEGQVAVFTHVAVDPAFRGRGVGRQLHDRSMKTLRMLGFSMVMAQLPVSLSGWYRALGWEVHVPGELVMWVEPPTVHDDAVWTGMARTFAPILFLEYLPRYPVTAERHLGGDRLIARWVIDGRVDEAERDVRMLDGFARTLKADPDLARRIPSGLVAAIGEEDPDSEVYRQLLAGRQASG